MGERVGAVMGGDHSEFHYKHPREYVSRELVRVEDKVRVGRQRSDRFAERIPEERCNDEGNATPMKHDGRTEFSLSFLFLYVI